MTSEEKFFIKETSPKLSKPMINIKGGVLTVQITGVPHLLNVKF